MRSDTSIILNRIMNEKSPHDFYWVPLRIWFRGTGKCLPKPRIDSPQEHFMLLVRPIPVIARSGPSVSSSNLPVFLKATV